MALLSFENAQSVDLLVYLIGFVVYLVLVWVPCAISAYLVRFYQPLTMQEFKYHWWKFKRQYIYLEIWFRTHVILGGSLCVIILAEPWNWGVRILAILTISLICGLLKYVSRLVQARIPGSNATKTEISIIFKDKKEYDGDMKEFMRKATSRDSMEAGDIEEAITSGKMKKQASNAADTDYIRTSSNTEQTMQKQIELAEKAPQKDNK